MNNAKSEYYFGIDYIRFFSAVCVMFYHYFYASWEMPRSVIGIQAAVGVLPPLIGFIPYAWWGWVGVYIFFVISGVVIAESAEGRQPFDFFRARFLRLMPAMAVFATIVLVLTPIYSPMHIFQAALLWFKSLLFFPIGPWLDGSYWTLTVEAAFYLVVFLALRLKVFPHIELAAMMALPIFFLVFLLGALDLSGYAHGSILKLFGFIVSRYLFRPLLVSTGAFFLLGVSLYYGQKRGLTLKRLATCIGYVSTCALGVWVLAIQEDAPTKFATSTLAPVLVWLGAIALMAVCMFFNRPLAKWISLRGLARLVGKMTYPIYLCHSIIGGCFLGLLVRSGCPVILAALLAMAAVVFVSLLFSAVLEPRVRRWMAMAFDRLADKLTGLGFRVRSASA